MFNISQQINKSNPKYTKEIINVKFLSAKRNNTCNTNCISCEAATLYCILLVCLFNVKTIHYAFPQIKFLPSKPQCSYYQI